MGDDHCRVVAAKLMFGNQKSERRGAADCGEGKAIAFVRGKLAQDRSALIEDLLLGACDGIDKALPDVPDKSDCAINIGIARQMQRRVIL